MSKIVLSKTILKSTIYTKNEQIKASTVETPLQPSKTQRNKKTLKNFPSS